MHRRKFLQFSIGAALSAGLPFRAFADTPDPWLADFHAALERKPWLLGFHGVEQSSFAANDLVFEGKWPEALRGTLYRNGPARHEVGNFRYRHWFDGDGLVQAFRVQDGRLRHRARLVATHKLTSEQAAGRALYPAFGSSPPDPEPVTSSDVMNPANISVLPHHERLFALWEGGSAHELDTDTLETRGIQTWSAESRGVSFSAHPRVEADGTLWNFGYASRAGLIVLWHIDARGKLVKTGVVPASPMGMPHDFLMTSRHLVVPIAPLHYDDASNANTFLDRHEWQPERGTRLLVVDKSDFSRVRWFDMPAQWIFHYGNAWEDEAGVIRFDAARADDPGDLFGWLRTVMRGEVEVGTAMRHSSYRLDLGTGQVVETVLTPELETEFPAVDPRVAGQRYSQVLVTSRTPGLPDHVPGFDSVTRLNVDTGRAESYRYPDLEMAEEHLYLPDRRHAPERHGWVLGTTLDANAGITRLNLFAADRLADGPIARASLPYAMPFGFHGKFVHER